MAAAELSIQLEAFCRYVLEMPEAPAPPWLLLPPRKSEMPQQAPEVARRLGASLAAPAVVRFADAPPADMVAQLELVHVPELPESSRLTLFKTELDATSASVLLQAGGVYVAAVGELTAFCAQHSVGCVVKGVVSALHSTLRRMVQEPRAADGLDREFRLPLFFAQTGERPGEVQLIYTDTEKGWSQVVLTHADGSTSKICVAVLLSAFEVLVLRRGAATTRIALPHPIRMRSPLLTSAHEAYIVSRRQPAAVDRKRKPVEAFDLKGVEPGKAKRAALSVWYQEGAKKVGYEGVVTSLFAKGLRVRFLGADTGIYEVTDEDEWAWGGLPE
mmetsp:Transcript_11693/g.37125  ORF Transcript_11693/g.37125 Transcript_11693/m.37125 type:complete len:330 (-) Transcript_11693:279-1268(-)